MKFIIGKKMPMTQLWDENSRVLAVTPVQAGPCVVTQVKTEDKDGYQALQLAYGKRKAKNIRKPQLGHLKSLDLKPQHLREFRTDNLAEAKVGDTVSVGTFNVGDIVKVTGTSKGKGFQGVVKRHGFAGFRKTHGNKDQERMPGSIGAKGPAQVFKNTRMPGRMGNERVSISNLEVIKIDEENNILFIKGAIPGAINGLILIQGEGELKLNLSPVKAEELKADEPKTEESKEETKTEEVKVDEEVKVEEPKEETKAEEVKEDPKVEEPKAEEAKKPEEESKEEVSA